jgi:hypothetical protein
LFHLNPIFQGECYRWSVLRCKAQRRNVATEQDGSHKEERKLLKMPGSVRA